MALLARQFGQVPRGLIELFQIAAVERQQAFEAGHEIVVGSHGVKLGVIDPVGKPMVIFGFTAPLRFEQ